MTLNGTDVLKHKGRCVKPWQRPSDHTPPASRWPRWRWVRATKSRPDLWANPERRAEREEARRLGISRKRLRKNWRREEFAS